MRGERGFPLSGVGWVKGEEDKGNHKDGISVTNSESEGDDSEQVSGGRVCFVSLVHRTTQTR